MKKVSLPTLYHCFESSASCRLRLALSLKKIDHNLVHYNLSKRENINEEYAKKNPSQTVPTLHINNMYLGESVAILEYLDEAKIGEGTLFPESLEDRYYVRRISEHINSAI